MDLRGSLSVAAPLERVRAALGDPDALAQALPGCERLIQLGPPTDEGVAIFETRLRLEAIPEVITARVTLAPDPDAATFHVMLHGRGPTDAITATGVLALATEAERQTRATATWRIEGADLSPALEAALANGVGSQFAQQFGARLAAQAEASTSARSTSAQRPGGLLVQTTPRGRIVAIPAEAAARMQTSWARPALVAGGGALVACVVAFMLIRHRARRL